MTTVIPNVFVPGTKAKAEDVNENFTVLADALNSQESAIDDKVTEALESMNQLKADILAEIEATGINNKANKNFDNVTWDSLSPEAKAFFNKYGLAPSPVKHQTILDVENGYSLKWTDPDDTVVNGETMVKWTKSVVVRKAGSYPQHIEDGTVVATCTTRNEHSENALVDEITDKTQNYKYRVFPVSENGVYSMSEQNKFGVWEYVYCEDDDESVPSKRITYLGCNANFKSAKMNFTSGKIDLGDWEGSPFFDLDYIKPVMLNFDGSILEELDPNDHAKTIDGTASHVADTTCNANAMVKKKSIFVKKVVNGSKTTYYLTNEAKEGYKCYSTLKEDGTHNEFYYTPIYDGSLVDDKIRSLSGLLPISGKTAQQEIDFARANGADWETELFCDDELERIIFKLIFKSTDSQSVLGQGKSNGGNSVGACLKSGTMNTKGHTWGSANTAEGVKFRYRENFYGSQWKRSEGLVIINGVPYVKETKHTADGSTSVGFNITGAGYMAMADIPQTTGSSGGYISKTVTNEHCTMSTVVSGSSSTFVPDGRWYNNSGTMYPFRGGSSYHGALCGAFAFSSGDAPFLAYWDIGASLSYRPS